MNIADTNAYLRRNPQIFEERIPNEQIPDIILFLCNNRNLTGYAASGKKAAPKKKAWYLSKALLIAAAAAVALALFFGATSTGRAVAGDFFETLVQYFSGEVHIQHAMTNIEVIPNDIEYKEYAFATLDEANDTLGVRAARIEGALPAKITATAEDGWIDIRCRYELAEGSVNLSESIALKESASGSVISGDGRPIDIQCPTSGLHFYGSTADTAGLAIAYHERRTIELSSQAITHDDFVRVLYRIRLE